MSSTTITTTITTTTTRPRYTTLPSTTTAPPIAPPHTWTRHTSCPVPWEAQDPTEAHKIGTSGYGPLHPHALTWGIGYHFPQAVLQAAFASGDSGEATRDGSADAASESPSSTPVRNGTMFARHPSDAGGDTWLLERAEVGAVPPDAHAAGTVLTCPRLEEGGSMGLEVWYGANSRVWRRERRGSMQDAAAPAAQRVVEAGGRQNADGEDTKGKTDCRRLRKMMGKIGKMG